MYVEVILDIGILKSILKLLQLESDVQRNMRS